MTRYRLIIAFALARLADELTEGADYDHAVDVLERMLEIAKCFAERKNK